MTRNIQYLGVRVFAGVGATPGEGQVACSDHPYPIVQDRTSSGPEQDQDTTGTGAGQEQDRMQPTQVQNAVRYNSPSADVLRCGTHTLPLQFKQFLAPGSQCQPCIRFESYEFDPQDHIRSTTSIGEPRTKTNDSA